MSRLAPLVDAAQWIDRTNWENTAISYYTFGAAIGLGFDLAIREHTNGRATLDDFMPLAQVPAGKYQLQLTIGTGPDQRTRMAPLTIVD